MKKGNGLPFSPLLEWLGIKKNQHISDDFKQVLADKPSKFKLTKENEPEQVLPENIMYGQVIKRRKKGIVIEIIHEIINGSKTSFNNMLKRAGCKKITTSLIERANLSIRHQTGRFKRKGMGFSKNKENHEHALAFFQAVYNYATPHRGLNGRTPAMSIKTTKRIWSIEDILRFQPCGT